MVLNARIVIVNVERIFTKIGMIEKLVAECGQQCNLNTDPKPNSGSESQIIARILIMT